MEKEFGNIMCLLSCVADNCEHVLDMNCWLQTSFPFFQGAQVPKTQLYIKVTHQRVPPTTDLCPCLVPHVKHYRTGRDAFLQRARKEKKIYHLGGATLSFVVGGQKMPSVLPRGGGVTPGHPSHRFRSKRVDIEQPRQPW